MVHRGLAVVLVAAVAGCGARTSPGQLADALPTQGEPRAVEETPLGGSTGLAAPPRTWGAPARVRLPALVQAELERNAEMEAIARALEGPERGRAAWTLGRIGGGGAAQVLVRGIEGPSEPALAVALAFLERDLDLDPASIPEDALEDTLWRHYAVAESLTDATAWLLAIGRLGGRASQERLAVDVEVLPSSEDRERYVAAMDAVGMLCARGIALETAGLRAIALGLQAHSPVRGAAAYALGRCAGPSAELLAGTERRTLVTLLEEVLRATSATESSDVHEARLAWIALAKLGELPQEIPEAILSSAPPPWWVEVEAVRALASHADGRGVLVERLAGLDGPFEGPRVHVVIEALRGLRSSIEGNPEGLSALSAWGAQLEGRASEAIGGIASAGSNVEAQSNADARAAKSLVLLRCEWRLLAAIGSGDVTAVEDCAATGLPATYGEVLAIEALVHARTRLVRGKTDAPAHPISKLLARAGDPRPEVAEAAIAALADIDDPRVNAVVRSALERGDLGVRTAAAATIAGRAVEASRRDADAIDPLVRIVAEENDEGSIEARVTAIDALAALARSKPVLRGASADEPNTAEPWLERVMLPLATEPSAAVRARARAALVDVPEALARFDAATPNVLAPAPAVIEAVRDAEAQPSTGLRVHTDAGVFTIAFADAPAPIAQAVLARLARDGFFTGLAFHRVVPGFVVQGGDPRGDGYGGPGYVMPCERSNLHYERGTVGIALAGKDTGGSQWFVTHTRQPHLDARYSVVGHVDAAGMEVVDRILPFDRITRIEILPAQD